MVFKLNTEIFFKGKGSSVVNFSFLHYETAKLRPQRIMVKSSKVSPPPLTESPILQTYSEEEISTSQANYNINWSLEIICFTFILVSVKLATDNGCTSTGCPPKIT